MQSSHVTKLRQALAVMATIVILKVTASVAWGYRDYFPPNFSVDFLHGRQAYFFGPYQGAFYLHIVAGPFTLLCGLILLSEQFRIRFPRWHRTLGKVQILLVLLLLAPSGLWLAYYAQSGPVAAAGFATLAIATAVCAVMGWRSAVARRFVDHRRWMWRCFLLLCSAVVLRLIGGAAVVSGAGSNWSYPLAAWVSWLVPLAIFEMREAIVRRIRPSGERESIHSAPSANGASLPAIEISARR